LLELEETVLARAKFAILYVVHLGSIFDASGQFDGIAGKTPWKLGSTGIAGRSNVRALIVESNCSLLVSIGSLAILGVMVYDL
jgi:hypothetical protein